MRHAKAFAAVMGLVALGTMAQAAGKPAPPSPFAHDYPKVFRTDSIDIPMKAAGAEGSELEYKVRMSPGQTLVYSWSVTAPKGEFYADFHSEQQPSPKEHEISHKAGIMASANGALVAPFQGIHGWYFQNQSKTPVVVHLKLAGFYDLLPGGKPSS